MDTAKAKALLHAERVRTQELMKDVEEHGQSDRVAANEPGDRFYSAEPLTGEGTDESILEELKRTSGGNRPSGEAR